MRSPDHSEAKDSKGHGWLAIALAIGGVCLAIFLLYRTLSQYSAAELSAAATAVPVSTVALCGLFAALSYLSLTGFDWLALRYTRHSIPYRHVALASFCSLSFGHNIGFAALSSGAVRYRFYSRMGVPLADIAKIIVFCGVTVALGLATVGGLSLAVLALRGEGIAGLSPGTTATVAAACLIFPLAYIALAWMVRTPLQFRKWTFEMPEVRIAAAQVAVGTINYVFVAACLHRGITAVADVSYVSTAATYVLANVTSLISHVPGGLGVLESVVLSLLPHAEIIAALMVFRLTYNLIPLILGGILFALSEWTPQLRVPRESEVNRA